MKIGIYDPYLDSLGGGEKYMLSAASCLSKEHEVCVFWNDKTILDQAHKKLNIDLTRVNIKANIFARGMVNKLFETSKYDRIFFLSDGSIPFTLAQKTFLHFQFPVEWVDSKSLANQVKLKKIAGVICNSKFTKKYVDKKFGIESKVVYPPCVPSSALYRKEEMLAKQNLVLTVGRYNALPEGGSFKKHEFMIETWKRIFDQGVKGWRFIIVTSYLKENKKYVDEMEKLIRGYPIEIIRDVSFEDISKLYKKSKIYWHATGFGEKLEKYPERAEHFGMTTVEAMYNGAVPVVINAGGQTEIIDQGKDGFLWNTEKELIKYTQSLIKDDSARIEMAYSAIEKTKQFGEDIFCRKLFKLIG